MSSNQIKAIDTSSVHRITSGQVIVDLQTAVKELVENALDAGATAVEVKFKNMGLDSIEVSDNGSGIPKQDYASLALKHHTSKLATFADLSSVLSFGFRGEALSSLCGLSESVEITTATAEETPTGTIIQFDRNGRVKDDTGKMARPRGTTVVVTNLFVPVPVRRKELEKHAKREFSKTLTLLHAYALNSGSKGQAVRLTVMGTSESGKKAVHLRTDGNPGLKAAISSLWGPKELVNLVPVDLELDVALDKSAVGRDGEEAGSSSIRVVGMISAPVPGKGRTSGDRQFLFINGRPCAISSVQRVINEVYKSFVTYQTPFNVLDIQLPTDACDINVSPDKRTIFLHNEANLLQGLRSGLEKMFAPSKSEYAVSQASRLSDDGPAVKLVQSTFPTSTASARPREDSRSSSPQPPPPARMSSRPGAMSSSSSSPIPRAANRRRSSVASPPPELAEDDPLPPALPPSRQKSRRSSDASMKDEGPVAEPSRTNRRSPAVEGAGSDDDEIEVLNGPPDSARQLKRPSSPMAEDADASEDQDPSIPLPLPSRPSARQVARPPPPSAGFASTVGDQTISFDFTSVASRLAEALSLQPSSSPSSSFGIKPEAIDPDLASIANLSVETAALELQRTIDKSDFAQMSVVGQYNLGFIVARKRSVAGDDLFIVDQHASDEKFNFETLQHTTRIQSQKLLHPRPLELSAADAVLVVENIDVLRQNGFDVSVEEDEETEETRLALSAQPISKETVFDFKDLEELLHLMHDRPTGEMVRCSKARSMFAMRACRKSIMIGKPLTRGQMTKVVQNMGLIDQPWNCPHGRPTMRHLMSLNRQAEKRTKGARGRALDWEGME